MRRKARCSCAKLSLEVEGEPLRLSMCHCRACQRRTGSVFGAQARFRTSDVTISGAARKYERRGDSGGRICFYFCPHCGSTLYYELESEAGVYAVPIGAFADPDFPAPEHSVYESHRHPWVAVPEGASRED